MNVYDDPYRSFESRVIEERPEAPMAWKNIELQSSDGISTITMSRPERRNALSLEHLEELIECFAGIGKEPLARVAILRAKGPAFCAGHDLAEMLGREPAVYH